MEKNGLKEGGTSDSDRISDLPIELLHHIFSFLPIESLAQTTILSKHWKHLCLWRSQPHLNFYPLSPELQIFFPYEARRHRKLLAKATKFLPDVLSRREQGSNITTFRLFGHVSCSLLQDCIDRLMHHRIEELELNVFLESNFDLPELLFNCNTLRVLKLNHQDKYRVSEDYDCRGLGKLVLVKSSSHFNYRTSASLPSVHTLSLTNVYIQYHYGFDLFSGINFPVVGKLCLRYCRGMYVLKVNCPGLEILELGPLGGSHGFLGLNYLDISCVGLLELEVVGCLRPYHKAKVFAPSLRRFDWLESFNMICTMESFEHIVL